MRAARTRCRISGFRATEVLRILQSTRRVVLIQISAINGVPEAFALDAHGADCDCAICHLDGAARFSEKRSVPTVLLHAPRSNEDTVSHHYDPNTDEAMLAGTSPNAETFVFTYGSQDIVGELLLRSHAHIV